MKCICALDIVSSNFIDICTVLIYILFISGGSLVDALRLLEGKLLPVDQVCSIMYQTAKAVQHMQVLYHNFLLFCMVILE